MNINPTLTPITHANSILKTWNINSSSSARKILLQDSITEETYRAALTKHEPYKAYKTLFNEGV